MADPAGLPEPPEVGARALPDGTFDGTTVAVTGGGTGLGKAIASEFARLGATIAILSRQDEHLAAGREAIGALGATVHTEPCDIREPDQIAAAFDGIEAAVGRPSVLINNAAANFPVPAEDMSPNAWRTVVDITLNGTFFCAREFARRHLAVGSSASIVNVGASYAWTGGPGFAHSAAAKAIMPAPQPRRNENSIWIPFADETAGDGVGQRVNAIRPRLLCRGRWSNVVADCSQ